MIEFIIYEEDNKYIDINKNVIEKVLMNYDIEYKISVFNNIYELLKIDLNYNNKIFILNCSSIKESAIDIIKHIREELENWNSMIIVTAKNNDYRKIIFEKRYLILDYIIKNNNYNKALKESLIISINNYNNRNNTLKFLYKKIFYNIDFKDIIYIEKEQDNKRCIIYTKNNNYYIPCTLTKIEKELDNRFIKCSRSYIINMEQVKEYYTKDNIIVLNNDFKIYEISRTKKDKLLNYFRGIK